MIIETFRAMLSACNYKPDKQDFLCLFGIVACMIACAIFECM